MGKRCVILGGNQVKTKLVSQKLSHLFGLEIIDGNHYIEAGKSEEVLSLILKSKIGLFKRNIIAFCVYVMIK